MKAKFIFIAMAIVLAAITQLQAQPAVETINVDTLVYLGKGVNGVAGGAFFLPDGNIIAVWKDTPIIIDSKTGAILRELEKSPVESVIEPELSQDGTKLVASRMGPRFEIWDVPSGKIVKQSDFIIRHFCLSPDGTKLYVTKLNEASNPGVISVIDMATLKETERFFNIGLYAGSYIAISPDGQTIALAAFKQPNDEYDTKTNQVILIDLNDKTKYTTLETFDPQVNSMEFSPDGKQIAFLHNGSSSFDDVYIYIYNLETKEKKYLRMPEFSTLFGFNVMVIGRPIFIDNNSIFTGIANSSGSKYYKFCWNIPEHKIKNYINIKYNQSLKIKDSTVLLCNQNGVIGYLNKNTVSVQEEINLTQNTINYQEGTLVFETSESGKMDIVIMDYLGNTIWSQSEVYMNRGENRLPIPMRLADGVYFCIVKSLSGTQTYKFMVY